MDNFKALLFRMRNRLFVISEMIKVRLGWSSVQHIIKCKHGPNSEPLSVQMLGI